MKEVSWMFFFAMTNSRQKMWLSREEEAKRDLKRIVNVTLRTKMSKMILRNRIIWMITKNDKYPTKIIETHWSHKLRELLNLENWEIQIRDCKIRGENIFQRRKKDTHMISIIRESQGKSKTKCSQKKHSLSKETKKQTWTSNICEIKHIMEGRKKGKIKDIGKQNNLNDDE